MKDFQQIQQSSIINAKTKYTVLGFSVLRKNNFSTPDNLLKTRQRAPI